jgi:flagellar hook assembly protein FlgD
MSTVGNVSILPPSSSTSTTGNAATTLTQQDFLKLMVAQFQAQDPLASDSGSGGGGSGGGASDYVNQLMSMTNLTTLQTVSSQQGLLLAQSLPGQTVTITNPNNTTSSGVVTSSTVVNGAVEVMVGGVAYPITEITAVAPTPVASTPTTTPSN